MLLLLGGIWGWVNWQTSFKPRPVQPGIAPTSIVKEYIVGTVQNWNFCYETSFCLFLKIKKDRTMFRSRNFNFGPYPVCPNPVPKLVQSAHDVTLCNLEQLSSALCVRFWSRKILLPRFLTKANFGTHSTIHFAVLKQKIIFSNSIRWRHDHVVHLAFWHTMYSFIIPISRVK